MVTKEEAKKRVAELVQEFKDIPKSHLDSMPEEDIKRLFITPLFEALGWGKFDILSESRILRGRADYIMKLGNTNSLVVEAKKTSVSLTEDEGRQAVSYAYHSKIKFAVLTNFKYMRVFHALSNIKNIDNNLLKISNNFFKLSFEEFVDKFDWLWFLSRESFEKEEINKLLSAKDLKVNKPIDKKLLEDLLRIREILSKELKSKNNYLENKKIDEIVQILMDRLVFIRSVEDRGLESQNYLLGLDSHVRNQGTNLQLFPYLIEKFKEFNIKYDSRLFEAGLLEKEGIFSDEILHKVIRTLYFGFEDRQSRYMYNEIPGDLFGNIYEQYLGIILAGTEKRVKLDSESGKRKKMGIYYTPPYIVEYIVKNTVGEYIKNKNIDEILETKILDPACGSGSFLIRAFQEICNIIKDRLNKGEEGSKILFKKPKEELFELNFGQKIEILRNCLYGVDLDEKAVELTRLNLMLKTLEGVGPEIKKPTLPHLSNIRCGNSLIADSGISEKAFNWNAQFPEIFHQGGFDIVIGNPPYGAELEDDEKEYLKKKFNEDKTRNTASLFIFLGNSVLKEKGNLSFIVPKQLTYTSSWSGTRKLLLGGNLRYVVDSSEAFEDVELEQIIFIFKKIKKEDKTIIVGFSDHGQILEYKSEIKYFNDNRFPLWITNKNFSIFEKILKNSSSLKDIAKVNWGGLVARYLSKNKTVNSIPCIRGREIQRYYSTSEYFIKKRDLDESYYVKGEKLIFQRIVSRYGEKIIANYRNARIVGTYANDDNYVDKTVTIIWDSKLNLKFLLAFFNSKLINWFAHRYLWNRSQLTMEFMYEYARNFPIPKNIPEEKQKKITDLVNKMLELQQKYHNPKISGNEKEIINQQIKNIDYEIDEEIYKLYGITDEEKRIIEDSLK